MVTAVAKPASPQRRNKPAFEPETFLARNGLGRKIVSLQKNETILSQGDDANAIFKRKGQTYRNLQAR